jgi:CheY-like chemotaxis protein
MAKKEVALIVDNDQDYLNVLNEVLVPTYLVKNAKSIKDATKIIEEQPKIKIALVDINLKDETDKLGLSLLHSLKTKNIPTIAITAVLDVRTVRDAFVHGGVKYFWFKQLDGKVELQDAIKVIVDEPRIPIREKSNVQSAFLQFTLALVGLPIIVFLLLAMIAMVVPQDLIMKIILAGFAQIVLLIITLALFMKRITGKQFTTVIKELLKIQ